MSSFLSRVKLVCSQCMGLHGSFGRERCSANAEAMGSILSGYLNPKIFRDFNRIRTHGLCVSAAVLYQRSYADPYIGSRQIG